MAEDEIRKHAKAAYNAVRDPHKDWKHKLQEIVVEILIIVFAVTISIWFHNWSESWKDRSEEKEFLTGLKADLQADLAEMESDRRSYEKELQGIRYFEKVGMGTPFSMDSLEIYQVIFFGDIQVTPRVSRFEALKGSGKLDILENKQLLLHITDLYTKDFPFINRINDFSNSLKHTQLAPYVINHLQLDDQDRGTNWQEILRSSPMRLMILLSEGARNSIAAYSTGIDKVNLILKEINEELK